MTKLSVNVNKLATLRNARGKNTPDVLATTLNIIKYGAEGITVHPRPDGRHIRKDDVYNIAKAIDVEFNIEGYPDNNFLTLVQDVKPAQCTLVPDPPHVLTSNAGWQIKKNYSFLKETINFLHDSNIRTSLFIDPMQITAEEIQILKEVGTDRIELYTEAYADNYNSVNCDKTLTIYKEIAQKVNELGIGLNAGHDLNLDNLNYFVTNIPFIKEVSIGHALICDALELGFETTIKKYLDCLRVS